MKLFSINTLWGIALYLGIVGTLYGNNDIIVQTEKTSQV